MTGYSRNAIVHQGRLDRGTELISKPLIEGIGGAQDPPGARRAKGTNSLELWRCSGGCYARRQRMRMLLFIIVILLLIGALPTWPYSAGWGYYPSGGLGIVRHHSDNPAADGPHLGGAHD